MAASTSSASADVSPWHENLKKFLSKFWKADGAVAVVLISICLSLSMGSTVAIIPEILSDRFARLYHGYSLDLQCSSFNDQTMPIPCRHGADDAQEASAWSSMLQNSLTLFCNPVIGRMSDMYGRRRIFILCTFLYLWGPLLLIGMQIWPTLNPLFYYVANSLVGGISYMGIAFATLSDSMPEEVRTASFGVIMAAFYGGFALSPFGATVMNHFQISIVSLTLASAAFLYALICFPETLPESVRENNIQLRTLQRDESRSCGKWIWRALSRPFDAMSILNRSTAIRLVAVGSFFSSMVYATDVNLVVFYIERYLNVRENDIAFQFLVMGIVGVVIQAVLLQPMLHFFGEKGLLVVSFMSGTLHNFLYGVARNKVTLYFALSLSQLTKTNTPILASLASQDASVNEQGQIQGALYAVNALSAAIGPVIMQFVYKRTKDNIGPGTMFLVASCLYFGGTIVVSFIPVKPKIETETTALDESRQIMEDLEEPLLLQPTESKECLTVDVQATAGPVTHE